MSDISALETEHARLSQYLNENALTGAGTPEYRKAVLSHRPLTDLLRFPTEAARANVAAQLKQIEDGTHPLLVSATKGTG